MAMPPTRPERLHGLNRGVIDQADAVPEEPAAGVRTWSARWPMANLGSVPMPVRPGASGSIRL